MIFFQVFKISKNPFFRIVYKLLTNALLLHQINSCQENIPKINKNVNPIKDSPSVSENKINIEQINKHFDDL